MLSSSTICTTCGHVRRSESSTNFSKDLKAHKGPVYETKLADSVSWFDENASAFAPTEFSSNGPYAYRVAALRRENLLISGDVEGVANYDAILLRIEALQARSAGLASKSHIPFFSSAATLARHSFQRAVQGHS